jgi:hypothetical protein
VDCPRCGRTKLPSSEAPLDWSVDDFVRAGIFSALLARLPVALGTQLIDLREHPRQQLLRRGGAYPGPLKIPNLSTLPVNLTAHMLNFSPDMFEGRHLPTVNETGTNFKSQEEPRMSLKTKKTAPTKAGRILIGVGGWTFPPWRSTFYPEKLAHSKELSYAASKLTSIEINGTYSG